MFAFSLELERGYGDVWQERTRHAKQPCIPARVSDYEREIPELVAHCLRGNFVDVLPRSGPSILTPMIIRGVLRHDLDILG